MLLSPRRLHVRDVCLRGRWPVQPGPSAAVTDLSGTGAASPAAQSSTSSTPGAAAAAAGVLGGGGGGGAPGRKQRPAPRSLLFPAAEEYGIRMTVRVGVFSSESVGEHFK